MDLKFGFDGYGHLDWFGLNGQTDSDPQIQKFGFYGYWILDPKQDSRLGNLDLRPGQNTVSTLSFLKKKICINKCIRKNDGQKNDENERKRMRKEGRKVWWDVKSKNWWMEIQVKKYCSTSPMIFALSLILFVDKPTYLVAPLHPWLKTFWFVQLYNLSREE